MFPTGFSRPSSGAQNCTHSARYLSDQYLTLHVTYTFELLMMDGNPRLKHVERPTEINKL